MKDCCNNCKLKLDIEHWDYTVGCNHEKLDGFICLAFAAEERLAIWMTNVDPNLAGCECYTPRKDIDKNE